MDKQGNIFLMVCNGSSFLTKSDEDHSSCSLVQDRVAGFIGDL